MNQKKGEEIKINIPTKSNKLLEKALTKVNSNSELKALWSVINVNAIDRLGMSDHGHVHFQIVANIALKFARILHAEKVKMNIESDHGLSYEHAEVVIFLASLFHDLGMTIDRDGHEEYSLIIANSLLRESLTFLPKGEQVIVTSEVLHAIISHRSGGKPLTLEAGIVRVADALDMSEGRTRIPYEAGLTDIHSISATAIDKVEIRKGGKKTIRVRILMNNSSGVFQVDELLKKKVKGSGLEKYIEVKAVVRNKEKKLVKEIIF
jgi:metal-dependent HD superfamily phosphatase/phosphodiesterase